VLQDCSALSVAAPVDFHRAREYPVLWRAEIVIPFPHFVPVSSAIFALVVKSYVEVIVSLDFNSCFMQASFQKVTFVVYLLMK
jgi:hypothetical protein